MILSVKKLQKSFGKKEALSGIEFSLDQGICGLLGPNGAGKTSLFRCITGIMQADKGDVEKPERIGYLPQRFGASKYLTVQEVLNYYAALKKIPEKKQKLAINEVVEAVNLTEQVKSRVETLSGGMIRRLGIAQAIMGSPDLILFDEPTAGLDPEERMRFKVLLFSLQRKKIPVMISTHIVEDVEAICDRILVMDHGRIVKDGTLSDIVNKAKEKVYLVPAIERYHLQEPFILERNEFKEGEELLRVISTEKQPGVLQVPTLEDGYICCIHGII